jgi:hypothetical protein
LGGIAEAGCIFIGDVVPCEIAFTRVACEGGVGCSFLAFFGLCAADVWSVLCEVGVESVQIECTLSGMS